VGHRAEHYARSFLEHQGLTTVATNYRCRVGELDLVMESDEELVIIEVRYRARPDPVDPELTVTARKRQRLLRAAAHFLQHHPQFRDYGVRLDVLAVSGPETALQVRWFRNAFTADELA
jgi:putative endonuclease